MSIESLQAAILAPSRNEHDRSFRLLMPRRHKPAATSTPNRAWVIAASYQAGGVLTLTLSPRVGFRKGANFSLYVGFCSTLMAALNS